MDQIRSPRPINIISMPSHVTTDDGISPPCKKLRSSGRIITIQNTTTIRAELPLSEAVVSRLLEVVPLRIKGSTIKKLAASTKAKIVCIIII